MPTTLVPDFPIENANLGIPGTPYPPLTNFLPAKVEVLIMYEVGVKKTKIYVCEAFFLKKLALVNKIEKRFVRIYFTEIMKFSMSKRNAFDDMSRKITNTNTNIDITDSQTKT